MKMTAESKSSLSRSIELDDLRLDRHVERRRRLVGDQDRRIARQRHRDHRPLPHPAGELMREVVDARLRVRDADLPQKLDRARPCAPLVDLLVRLDRLDDLLADPVDRVQRGHRVLEDHPELVAAVVLHVAVRDVEQIGSLVEHLALEACVHAARQPHERHRGDALARARLADDPEHLAALELERDAVDRPHDPVLGRELDLEVVDLEQAFRHQVSRILGSRYAYATSTSVEKTTMNVAP